MAEAAPALIHHSSFDVATTVMSPAHVREKFEGHDIPISTEEQKVAGAKEVGFGMSADDVGGIALEMASTGLPIPGLAQASAIIGVPFMFWARDFNARKDMQQLTDQYRDVIAEKTNLTPEQVNEHVLLRYATQNEALGAAVKAIAHKRESHIANTAGGIGGMLGGTALAGLALTGVGAPIAMVGALAGGYLGYEGGESVTKYFTNSMDGTNPSAVLEAMQEKREKGDMISTQDVFALRVAQTPMLQEAIVAKHGDNFHALDEMAQREVMTGVPAMLQQSMRDAAACNLPEADMRYLLVGEMPNMVANVNAVPSYANQPTKWVNQVAANTNRAPAQGSWANRIAQQRSGEVANTLEI